MMKKRYYKLVLGLTSGKAGEELVNFDDLVPEGRRVFDIDHKNPKMPNFPVPPRYIFDKDKGVLPGDAEQPYGLWFISEETKRCMEKIAPDALEFAKCETFLPSGEEGPEYWYCLATKVIEAIDEEKSILNIRFFEDGTKNYRRLGSKKIVFDEEKIGNTHVFRPKYMATLIVCDDYFKDACEAAGLKLGYFSDIEKLKW